MRCSVTSEQCPPICNCPTSHATQKDRWDDLSPANNVLHYAIVLPPMRLGKTGEMICHWQTISSTFQLSYRTSLITCENNLHHQSSIPQNLDTRTGWICHLSVSVIHWLDTWTCTTSTWTHVRTITYTHIVGLSDKAWWDAKDVHQIYVWEYSILMENLRCHSIVCTYCGRVHKCARQQIKGKKVPQR